MTSTCFICMFKFTSIFTSLCYGLMNYNCPHNKKDPSRKTWVSDSPTKRLLCSIFHTSVVILGIMELYLIIKTEYIGDATALNIMELVTSLVTIITIIQANLFWKKKLTETRVMIHISHYLNKFPVEDRYFVWNYRISIAWILLTIGISSFEITMLLIKDDINILIYLKCINRISFGYLQAGFYLKFWLDMSSYVIFLKRLFDQISREVKSKMYEFESTLITNQIFVVNPQTTFLKKLKTSRRLYLMILESFQRTRHLYVGILQNTILGNFLIAIWILAMSCIALIGRHSLGFNDYAVFIRFTLKSALLITFSLLTDSVQTLIENLQTVLYKLPSRQLTLEEEAEVENFIKLLSWKQPMHTTRDSYQFSLGSLCSLSLEVVVNSMVVTQLYIFLDQQIKDT